MSNKKSAHRETSAAQIAANRRNAQRSTGPRSADGKARSALNAVSHGCYTTAAHAIESGVLKEDQAEVDELVDELVRALDPRDSIEFFEAREIARVYLRLQRCERYEAQVMSNAGKTSAADLRLGVDDEVSNDYTLGVLTYVAAALNGELGDAEDDYKYVCEDLAHLARKDLPPLATLGVPEDSADRWKRAFDALPTALFGSRAATLRYVLKHRREAEIEAERTSNLDAELAAARLLAQEQRNADIRQRLTRELGQHWAMWERLRERELPPPEANGN